MAMLNFSSDFIASWEPEETLIYRVQQVAVPVVIAAGIIGNTFSVWVLMMSPLRGLSSSFYLSALCASDTGFLLGLFIAWLPTAGTDLYNRTGWCQGITYACHVTTFLSVWLVVAFTTERFIAVCYPLMRPAACTVGRAKVVISVLLVASLGLYSYVPVIAGVVTFSGLQSCSLKDDYELVNRIMSHVDTIVTMFVPLVVIVILNVKIIRCVRYVERLRPQMLSIELLSKAQPGQLRVTKTLLVVSSVFILLNLPSYGIRALQYITTLPPTLLYYTLSQTFQLLFYVNFSINFLLYCVAGQNFRAAVVAVCRQRATSRAQNACALSRAHSAPGAILRGNSPAPHASLVTVSSQPQSGGRSAPADNRVPAPD